MWKRNCQTGNGFTLFILKEDLIIIKIIKSSEDPGVLIDGVTETVQDAIKRKEAGFLVLYLHL